MKKKIGYRVEFGRISKIGDVSFSASNLEQAKKQVKRIAKEINLKQSPWTLWSNQQLVASGSNSL